MRVGLLPAPGVAAHLLDPARGAPAEALGRQARVGPAGGDVAGAAWNDLVRDRAAARLLEGAHELEHAMAPARPEVHRQALRRFGGERAQRRQVPQRQVDHVQVIAHPRGVG